MKSWNRVRVKYLHPQQVKKDENLISLTTFQVFQVSVNFFLQVEKLPYLKRFDFFLVFLRVVFHHSFSLFLCAHGELEIACEEAFTLKIEAHQGLCRS